MKRFEWIDNLGQSRIDHDDNYQMIMRHGEDASLWFLMDSWNIYFAAKVIVLGYTEDVQAHLDFLSQQDNSLDRDLADSMNIVLNRFYTLAQSAINAGILKEFDTPANWLKWAESKKYKIGHLGTKPYVSLAVDRENGSLIELKKTKLQRQQEIILNTIKTKGFDPKAIPDGGKGTIKSICEQENKDGLFNAVTAFDRAWKKGIEKLMWKMEYHESYAHRGNN